MQLYIMMGILLALLQNGKMTAQQLADKFEVSKRSVYRYLDSLSANGVPIVTDYGRNGGAYIDSKFLLQNIFITKQELCTIGELLDKKDDAICTTLNSKINYLIAQY